MTKEQFIEKMNEDDEWAPGWDVIDNEFKRLYPDIKEEHFGTNFESRAMFGGNQYLDGYSIYASPKGYKHIVTYGMTILYADESAFGGEWNGWGYEMTIKLKEENTEECMWALDMLSNLARYTYTSKRFFEPNQFIGNGGRPLRIDAESKITALLVVEDTEALEQDSIYGKTMFLQMVGITQQEFEAIVEDVSKIDELIAAMKADGNPDLVTDMKREKSYL